MPWLVLAGWALVGVALMFAAAKAMPRSCMTRLPSSRRGPTLRSSRARRRLGLDQPTAVIQPVRLDTGNENHLSPTEVRDVARRMILIVAELANPVKAAQKAPPFIHCRQGSLDRRPGSGRVDQVRPENVAVVVLSPNRFSSKPDRLLTKEIRPAGV